MLGKFYVVTLNCGARTPPNDAIERALAQPFDWLRFSRECYFVYAFSSTPEAIYYLLKPLLHGDDQILVAPIDSADRHGWTSQLAVNWFSRPRL